MCRTVWIETLIAIVLLVTGSISLGLAQEREASGSSNLRAEKDPDEGTVAVYREGGDEPVLVQNAPEDTRPYLHPIVAPDGNGVLTQLRPDHHTHQTGLYWGFKRLNGRDYFAACCKPDTTGYYRRVSYDVVRPEGRRVEWQTVYDLLDENGEPVLTETHRWRLAEVDGEWVLDLEWHGEARTDVTVGEFFVGGLFLRMPWYKGIEGRAVNAAGRVDGEAEAGRAPWIDVGMEIDGRNDWGHVALLDHPRNEGFPIPWRVDGQLGVGPSRQIMGDWGLDRGEQETIRYRMVVYTGEFRAEEMHRRWIEYAAGR